MLFAPYVGGKLVPRREVESRKLDLEDPAVHPVRGAMLIFSTYYDYSIANGFTVVNTFFVDASEF